ncbi:MAG: bile acid:sodium symporter family protein [Owenweeksia sp.]
MENNTIDSIQLNFDQEGLFVLNICLAVVMFGVALGLSLQDFRNILKAPKPALVGITSQFLLLPLLTFLLVLLIEPAPSLALGMILLAACPGGNISNFMSQLAGGNSALSVTLTAFSTALAIIFTPLNLQFWGSLYPPTLAILQKVSIDPLEVFKTIILILGLPLIAGMLMNRWKPNLSKVLSRILKPLSIAIFIGLVIVAFSKNTDIFTRYIHYVVLIVFIHNAVALSSGFFLGKVSGLSRQDCRTLAIETGIQNSGLGLLLIFSFFQGLGGMALIAGWWSIWHIIAGLSLSFFWSSRKSKTVTS